MKELFAAIEMLDKLPVPILEALRDYVSQEYRSKVGRLADFVRSYLGYLGIEIADATARDRKLRYRISRDILENYQLPRSPIEGENRDDANRFAGSLSGSHGLLPLKLGIVGPSGAFRTQ